MNWQSHFAAHPRSRRQAELWSRYAIAHLRTHARLHRGSSVLDFGCGYFDVGRAIAPHLARMDGLEIDEHSLKLARSRAAELPNTAIYAANEVVPPRTYDLILANSVFQYLDDDAEILETLERFRTWMKPGSAGRVLLIDLIPTWYSPPRDAARSMWVALRHGIPFTMFRFLWAVATSPHGRSWHRVDPRRMAELASAAGFTCTRLSRNLAPSLQRYTCELSLC